jgi:hypothetical protein
MDKRTLSFYHGLNTQLLVVRLKQLEKDNTDPRKEEKIAAINQILSDRKEE